MAAMQRGQHEGFFSVEALLMQHVEMRLIVAVHTEHELNTEARSEMAESSVL